MLIAATFPMNLSGAELSQVDLSGMQIAWVLVPSTSTSKDTTEVAKPKPAKAPTIEPTQTPKVQPAQAPVEKPIQAPVVKPVQAPVSKPAVVVAAKSVQPPVKKEANKIEWVIGLGMDFGGEELGTVVYSDGSTAPVKANYGFFVNAGAILPNGKNSSFSTQMTVGYKYGGPKGLGGNITWSAIPLELIEYYHPSNLRMGLGISYQIAPQLSVNVPASSYSDKYNNAIGFIAQIGWAPAREHYSVDLRYTSIKFSLTDVPGAPTVDGSVAGLYASYRF